MKRKIFIVLCVVGSKAMLAQIGSSQLNGQTLNPITTAVPFLMISPDSKQGAMGDAGAATDPDVNSIHWNGSKLAFAERKFGAGFTVTPWLKRLVPDINMYYLAGYGRLNDRQTVGGSLRYFTLGDIQLTDATGTNIGNFKPNEFAVDLAFSQKLSKNFGLGIATRFINSGISRVYFQGSSGNAASTFAVDLSSFYRSEEFKIADKNVVFQAGAAIIRDYPLTGVGLVDHLLGHRLHGDEVEVGELVIAGGDGPDFLLFGQRAEVALAAPVGPRSPDPLIQHAPAIELDTVLELRDQGRIILCINAHGITGLILQSGTFQRQFDMTDFFI